MLDKHAPFKQANLEEQKEALKHWLTTGIKKSIKVMRKLHKEMVKEKGRGRKRKKVLEMQK